MSTKQQSTIQYSPSGMGTYNSLQGGIGKTLNDFMKNPLQSSFFNQNVGMGNRFISGQNSAAMQGILNNWRTSGIGGSGASSPAIQSMIAQQRRANAGAQSNNFLQNLNMARSLQLGATQTAASYSPLMTGQTSTTSGLGTWLPQVLGAAGSAALGFATGGASAGMGGAGGAFNIGGASGLGSAFGSSGQNFMGAGGLFGSSLPSFAGFGGGGALGSMNPFTAMALGGGH